MIRTVTVVSLSAGTIGESFVSHEIEIGIRRLEAYGLKVKFSAHARMGRAYIAEHPEKRAEDLLDAFRDEETDMILCAIGGDDTYRLAPYLFDNNELEKALSKKVFLGFSDTTFNHFMLHKVGLPTFYGQSFLADLCELAPTMLPYTRTYFEELICTGTIREVRPSDIWYEARTDYSEAAIGTEPRAHRDSGFELLQGSPRFRGEILGGCIDSLYDFFDGERYGDCPEIVRKYGLFPEKEDWTGKILLLESSEEQMPPEKYEKALTFFKEAGVFDVISGVIVGKPMDRVYEAEYREKLRKVIGNPALPIVCNLNIGHALPRCILPFGVPASVDAEAQTITFDNK